MSSAFPDKPVVPDELRETAEGGLDHVLVHVKDFEASKAFYTLALAPLGYKLLMDYSPGAAGFAIGGKPDFWISPAPAGKAPTTVHVAFKAANRQVVDDFYAAGLAAGSTDNGKPGLRPNYHPAYYGGFLLDPDGNNIEAVCHCADGGHH